MDLDNNLDINLLEKEKIVKLSIKENKGLSDLKNKIKVMYNTSSIDLGDFTYISNAENVSTLKNCLNKVNDIKLGIERFLPIDMIEIDIKSLWNLLGKITGDTYQDELIDKMFSKFCLGK